MQRTATTPLLNKLKPSLYTAVRGGRGRERGREEKEGSWKRGRRGGVTAHPGVTAGILLTSAQRRRAARLSLEAERKRSRPRPRHKQPNKEIVIIVFVPSLFLRCWSLETIPHLTPLSSTFLLTFIRPLCHHLSKRRSNSSIFHPFNFRRDSSRPDPKLGIIKIKIRCRN